MIQHDLSFHFKQPWFEWAGLRFAFQVHTTDNIYGLDANRTQTMRDGQGLLVQAEGLTWAGGDELAEGALTVRLRGDGFPLLVTAEASHGEPIKGLKVILDGLQPGSVTSLGQISNDQAQAVIPEGGDLLIQSPGWTPSGVVFLHHGARCVAFSSRDTDARPKRVYLTRRVGAFRVELIIEQDATRWGNRMEAAPWWLHLDTTPAAAAAEFMSWLEVLDGLRPWEERSDVPAWARDLRLVVNLHGEHWSGYIFNTFDEMLKVLKTLNQWMPARHILAYLPGFSGRYYHDYPSYKPAERLGGEAGFRRLVEGARALGCRVMPMFGAHGSHVAAYPQWKQAVVTDRAGVAVQRLNLPDWDADRAGEAEQVFLNLGEPGYRAYLYQAVSELIQDYDLEAVFFDTIGWLPNDPRYSMWLGYQTLFSSLRESFPHVLWSSEGVHSRLLQYFPLVQLQLRRDQRFLYPEFVYRFIRGYGHLDTGAPGLGSSGVHERGFHGFEEPVRQPFQLPALSIVRATLEAHRTTVQRVCELANQFVQCEDGDA